MKALNPPKPVLWFLFVFNLVIALATGIGMDGSRGVATSIGMGVVAVGAGFGLLRNRGSQQQRSHS